MIPTEALVVLANAAGGYLLGSVPFGWVIGKARGIDIREHGSKNIGATNCWRVCGWPFGLAAFILDVAKGFVPVFVAVRWLVPRIRPALGEEGTDAAFCWLIVTLVALGPLLGHIWPVWLRFKGGKGVAVGGGGVIGLMPLAAAVLLGLWLVILLTTRYSSLASITCAVVATPLAALMGYPWSSVIFTALGSAAVLVLHRGNLMRLLRGQELRIQLSRPRRA